MVWEALPLAGAVFASLPQAWTGANPLFHSTTLCLEPEECFPLLVSYSYA